MTASGMRTTIYLARPAAEVLERVKAEYRDRYGIGTTVSAVFARLLLGESIGEVIGRPYRIDLARIADESNKLRNDLRRAPAKRRTALLHRVHREVAALFPPVKQIVHTLGHARRRNEPPSPDLAEASRLEKALDALMAECSEAIVSGS